LESELLTESSGIADSHGYYWSHNDSGDRPRLFAFARSGALVCEVQLSGAQAVDWEDMCAFNRKGRSYLAVGDVGDNDHRRSRVVIYVVELDASLRQALASQATLTVVPSAIIEVTYPDGSVNCEALAYDAQKDCFVLATKEPLRCRLFEVETRGLDQVGAPVRLRLAAQFTDTLVLPLVTGGDIAPSGKQMVLTTYGPGCLLTRHETDGWNYRHGESATIFELPPRKQGESVCFSEDGKQLLLTSEFAPTPLHCIDLPQLPGTRHSGSVR
jgi:hypothetical protein